MSIFLISAFSTSSVIAQGGSENSISTVDLVFFQELKDKIDGLQQRLEVIERSASESVILKEKIQWLERELTNSLMDISNVLDVSGMNMDAAHASIEASQSAVSASEAYLEIGSYAATVVGIVVALAAIAAAISLEVTNRRIRNVASAAADDIIKEFVSSSNDVPNHGTRKVLEAVRDSVKQDLEETPALLVQNDEFKKMLTRLVDAAVSTKLSKDEGDSAAERPAIKTLDDDDFTK